MPDPVTSPAPAASPAGADPAPTPDPAKFAGKYETPEAFEKGIFEARKAIGLPDLPAGTKLIGQDGLYADVRAAELGYRDLTSMMRHKAPPAAKPAPPTPDGKPLEIKPAQAQPAPQDMDIPDILAQAGLDTEVVARQWLENGKLTDEQYASLQKLGYGKKLVDSMARGETADLQLRSQAQATIKVRAQQMLGGEEQLGNLLGWAASLPEPLKADLNRRLADPNLYEGALMELQNRHAQVVGAAGSNPLIEGGAAPSQPTGGFTFESSRSDFMKTMRDAQRGNPAALARINSTPMEVIAKMSM